MTTPDSAGVLVPDETLHEIVNLLEKAVRPRVLYRPDQQRMAEEAMEVCQKNVRQALKQLNEALPAGYWLGMKLRLYLVRRCNSGIVSRFRHCYKPALTGTRRRAHVRKNAFKSHFAYNYGMNTSSTSHPARHWEQDAFGLHATPKLQLRLAAMAGHMRIDQTAARRAALIDLLADGRPHPREEIWESVSAQLEADCWGKRPHESVAHDLDVLRQGGLRIGYSRRPQINEYYLQYPTPAPAHSTPNLRPLTGPGYSICASYRG